jgi:beta-alanine degradation protein BauB
VGCGGNSIHRNLNIMKLLLKSLLVLVLSCSLSSEIWAAEDDPVKLAPKNYRATLNNDKVRVLDVWLKPGQKVPMHSHPDYIIYVLSGGVVKFTDDKGKETKVRVHAGQTMWRNDEEHAVENIGKTTVHVLNIELKGVRIF